MYRLLVFALATLSVTGTACGSVKPECEFPATVIIAEGNRFDFTSFTDDSVLVSDQYKGEDELFVDLVDGVFRINGVAHLPQVMPYRKVQPKENLSAWRNVPVVQRALAGRPFDAVDSLTLNRAVWRWDERKVEVLCAANAAWRSMLYEGAEAAAESAKETVLHFADMADNATVESSSAEQAVLMVHWMGYGNEEAIVGVDFHCPDATKRPCSEDDACAYLAILRQLESTKEKVVIAFTFGNVSYDQGAPAQRAEGR